jgi:hypothetical protein
MAGQLAGQPIYILREGSQRTKGRDAQHNNIMDAKAVAAAVRTTLGPQGMDIEHPATKMIVEVAKTNKPKGKNMHWREKELLNVLKHGKLTTSEIVSRVNMSKQPIWKGDRNTNYSK